MDAGEEYDSSSIFHHKSSLILEKELLGCGVLTKIDLMDKGTNAVDILEWNSYRLKFPWVGVVDHSQEDINKMVDITLARRREREYFSNSPEYKHLAPRMGSEYLAKLLSSIWKGLSHGSQVCSR